MRKAFSAEITGVFVGLRRRSMGHQGRLPGPSGDMVLPELFAADGQAVDADCGTGDGAAEFEVAGDFGDVLEHFF